jgi:hypothetical protein
MVELVFAAEAGDELVLDGVGHLPRRAHRPGVASPADGGLDVGLGHPQVGHTLEVVGRQARGAAAVVAERAVERRADKGDEGGRDG